MPKIARKSAKIFASNATAAAGGIAQFGSLAAGTPNYSTDPDVIQGLSQYADGWSAAVLGTKSPALEDRNALDYLISYQQAYLMQQGVPEWLSTETYYKNSYVVDSNGDLRRSIIDNNTNHDPANDIGEYWAFAGAKGGSRNIGEIVDSTIPLTDQGLHLLDGSLLNGSGIYQPFVSFIDDLYNESGGVPDFFTTEALWQDSVTKYGVCSKFVYTPAAGGNPATVRLPKMPANERYLIDSYSADDAWYRIYSDGWCEQGNYVQSTTSNSQPESITLFKSYLDTNYSISITYDLTAIPSGNASSSGVERLTTSTFNVSRNQQYLKGIFWEACGYIDISDYGVLPNYHYIVLTNVPRTQTQIDIDEIVTDLNGKVDKSSLEEVKVVVEEYHSGNSWYRVWSDGFCEQGSFYYAGSSLSGDQTITFPKAFPRTDYTFMASAMHSNANANGYALYEKYESRTSSGTVLHFPSNLFGYAWVAYGYIN